MPLSTDDISYHKKRMGTRGGRYGAGTYDRADAAPPPGGAAWTAGDAVPPGLPDRGGAASYGQRPACFAAGRPDGGGGRPSIGRTAAEFLPGDPAGMRAEGLSGGTV